MAGGAGGGAGPRRCRLPSALPPPTSRECRRLPAEAQSVEAHTTRLALLHTLSRPQHPAARPADPEAPRLTLGKEGKRLGPAPDRPSRPRLRRDATVRNPFYD